MIRTKTGICRLCGGITNPELAICTECQGGRPLNELPIPYLEQTYLDKWF